MIQWLKQNLYPIEYQDEDLTRKSRLLNIVLVTVNTGLTLLLVLRTVADLTYLTSRTGLILLGFIGLLTGTFILTRLRRLQLSIYTLVFISWFAITLLAWNADGVRDSAFLAYFAVILVASLLAGWRLALLFAGLTILSGWGNVYAESVGWIPPLSSDASSSIMTDYTVILSISGVLIYLLINSLQTAVKNAQESEQALQLFSQQLEKKVQDRTQILETSIQIGQTLTAILNQELLVNEVVNQIIAAFDYYYVQIYLLDEASGRLYVAGGTGEAGALLKAQDHALGREQGLVGQAARENRVILVADTGSDTNWLPNPHLPNTRSEIAVPITVENQVLGVLDVQHDVVDGLDENDSLLLQSVAAQVGIALRNARLYAQAQQRAEQESVVNEIGRQIQSAANVEMVLEIAARELGQKLGASRTSIGVGRDYVGSNGRMTKRS
ncbi:GAF domain-containing protein [Candidatus Leptofilum sp.]|uniref:GAF domain-containing protein n=1 Tax=Candidatus Leptofilum sp. TaxID=3241576 RepID=UPI003B5AF922